MEQYREAQVSVDVAADALSNLLTLGWRIKLQPEGEALELIAVSENGNCISAKLGAFNRR